MSPHVPESVVEFDQDTEPALANGRLDAPAFHRNHQAIGAVLEGLLGPCSGNVIEVGSGTGQHIVAFARALPHLTWWPSDLAPEHLRSIDAWRRHGGVTNIKPPVMLDAAVADWHLGEARRPPRSELAAILSINVLHIAPWAVAEGLMRAARRYLNAEGYVIVYGPFSRDGRHTASSNAAFDTALRAHDPTWGVRDTADLEALAVGQGLRLIQTIGMPANNLVLVLTLDR